jgi:Helix-turn-helix domain
MSESHGFFGVQYLTVAQVAACLNVSKMTIYRLVHSGECRPPGSDALSASAKATWRTTSTGPPRPDPSKTGPQRTGRPPPSTMRHPGIRAPLWD